MTERIIDDTIVYRVQEDTYLMVPNASMTGTVFDWIDKRRDRQEVSDVTDQIACFAVQGPEAAALMERLTDRDLSSLKKFHFITLSLDLGGQPRDVVTGLRPRAPERPGDGRRSRGGGMARRSLGARVMLSRTGYTGEDGFEVLCDARAAVAILEPDHQPRKEAWAPPGRPGR